MGGVQNCAVEKAELGGKPAKCLMCLFHPYRTLGGRCNYDPHFTDKETEVKQVV